MVNHHALLFWRYHNSTSFHFNSRRGCSINYYYSSIHRSDWETPPTIILASTLTCSCLDISADRLEESFLPSKQQCWTILLCYSYDITILARTLVRDPQTIVSLILLLVWSRTYIIPSSSWTSNYDLGNLIFPQMIDFHYYSLILKRSWHSYYYKCYMILDASVGIDTRSSINRFSPRTGSFNININDVRMLIPRTIIYIMILEITWSEIH